MKNTTQELVDTIANDHFVHSSTRARAVWSYNRFNTPTITNSAADQWPDTFPLSSVIEPRRPKKSGIVKMFMSDNYLAPAPKFEPRRNRYYPASKDAEYKYWVTGKSAGGLTGSGYNISGVAPTVIYATSILTNQITVLIEASHTVPETATVQISTDGTAWTTVSTNPTFDLDGRLTLYRQDNGSWSDTEHYGAGTTIKGIRLNVTQVDEPNAYFGLIELNALLGFDITSEVVDYNSEFSISDRSLLSPLGSISSNQADITLSNETGLFTYDNPDSFLKGMTDKGVEFRIDIGIEVAGVPEYVRMVTMHSESRWTENDDDTVSITLVDSSDWLKTLTPPKTLFKNQTIGSIVWTLCDTVGVSNVYAYDSDDDYGMSVPYFWTDGEEPVWEALSRLSQETQTAIYFDEYDDLVVMSRRYAFDPDKDVSWPYDAVHVGDKLSDIETYTEEQLEENTVAEINYTPTAVSNFNNGFPKMEVVWQPESLVVRAAAVKTVALSEPVTNYVTVSAADAQTWPYEGKFSMDGEVMKYSGKQYYYYNNVGTMQSVWLTSDEQKTNVDTVLSGVNYAWKNAYSGKLRVTARGQDGTEAVTHSVTYAAEVAKKQIADGTGGSVPSSMGSASNSLFTIAAPADWTNGRKNFVASYGAVDTATYRQYGTRLRFVAGAGPDNNGEAGLWIGGTTSYSGYYINLVTTANAEANAAYNWNEVTLMSRNSAGISKAILGERVEVLKGKWYDLEATITRGTNDVVRVWLNGTLVLTATVTGADKNFTASGKCGFYMGQWCTAQFEYFYTMPLGASRDTLNTVRDLVSGGYISNETVGISNTTSSYRTIFDDFGPYIHEIREFDVTFEPAPVTHSNLYFSNETEVACTGYVSTPFGAKFTLENNARKDAIMTDDDTTILGEAESVKQSTFIYGRVVTQDDALTHTVTNDAAVRRKGKVRVEYQSDWIQTKEAAEALGTWLVEAWAGSKTIAITVFGNPVLQLGDAISINHPRKNIDPDDNKFIIVGITQDYSEGLVTNITATRVI